jgi:hypothetical protein
MTVVDATPQRIRPIGEVVAELKVQLQQLRPTDRRRLKLAAKLTVLEDRIANQPADHSSPVPAARAMLRDTDLARPSSPARVSRGIWLPLCRRYRTLATALSVVVNLQSNHKPPPRRSRSPQR